MMAISMVNKNSSPKEKRENYKKNSQLISYEVKEKENIEKILNILEENGLICNVLFDRLDTNTDKEHLHFYYDKNINHNTITKVVNDYLKYGIVNENKIAKGKIIMEHQKRLRLYGVLSYKKIGFDSDNKKIKKLIFNTTNSMIFLIAKDKDGIPIHKPFSTNTGLKPKPIDLFDEEKMKDSSYHTLQGKYDFIYTFNKDVDDIVDIVKKTEEAVVEVFTNNKYDISLIDLKVSVDRNELRIIFNNLLIDMQNPKKLYMISSKNMNFKTGGFQEIILKRLADKLKLKINTQKVAMWKDEESRRNNLDYKLKREQKEFEEKIRKVNKEIPDYEEVIKKQKDNKIEEKNEFDTKILDIESKIEEYKDKLIKLEDVQDIIDVKDDIKNVKADIDKNTIFLEEIKKAKEIHFNNLKRESENKDRYKLDNNTSTFEILGNTKYLDFISEVKSLSNIEEIDNLMKDIDTKVSKLESVREFADVENYINEWKEKLSIVNIIKIDLQNSKKFEQEVYNLSSKLLETVNEKDILLKNLEQKDKEMKELKSLVIDIKDKILQKDKVVEDLYIKNEILEKSTKHILEELKDMQLKNQLLSDKIDKLLVKKSD